VGLRRRTVQILTSNFLRGKQLIESYVALWVAEEDERNKRDRRVKDVESSA
jgi:hypothetical protein